MERRAVLRHVLRPRPGTADPGRCGRAGRRRSHRDRVRAVRRAGPDPRRGPGRDRPGRAGPQRLLRRAPAPPLVPAVAADPRPGPAAPGRGARRAGRPAAGPARGVADPRGLPARQRHPGPGPAGPRSVHPCGARLGAGHGGGSAGRSRPGPGLLDPARGGRPAAARPYRRPGVPHPPRGRGPVRRAQRAAGRRPEFLRGPGALEGGLHGRRRLHPPPLRGHGDLRGGHGPASSASPGCGPGPRGACSMADYRRRGHIPARREESG